MEDYDGEKSDLTLSLDVIYHLVEDDIFSDYMKRLFLSSKKYVVIYSSNTDKNPEGQSVHVKHRKFSKWIEGNISEWELLSYIPNKYPFSGDTKTGSFSDFFIYKRHKNVL